MIRKHILCFIVCLSLLTGCKNYNLLQSSGEDYIEDIELFNQASKTETVVASLNNESTSKAASSYTIKADDKISVSIWNHEDLSVGSVFGDYNSNEVYGKWMLIDKEGKISLPKIGRVVLAGLTIDGAEDKLTASYSEWLKDPIIVVKVLNRKVTVLGEVGSAGNINLEKERYFLAEILAHAGGLTDFADARELSLIRNNTPFKLDLTTDDGSRLNSLEIIDGDVIYVPAQKSKSFIQKSPGVVAISGVISTLALLFTILGGSK